MCVGVSVWLGWSGIRVAGLACNTDTVTLVWCANSDNFHVYALSKLHFIQSIRVIRCAQGWDKSTCNLESDHPSCKNVVTVKSNYCSLPAWPWRQRQYNPSKCWELLAQQHSITILQTGIYSVQDSCWPTILTSHVWDVTVWISTGAGVWGEGIASIVIHTITPQRTVTHAIPTLLPVLFNDSFILTMVPLCLPAKT